MGLKHAIKLLIYQIHIISCSSMSSEYEIYLGDEVVLLMVSNCIKRVAVVVANVAYPRRVIVFVVLTV